MSSDENEGLGIREGGDRERSSRARAGRVGGEVKVGQWFENGSSPGLELGLGHEVETKMLLTALLCPLSSKKRTRSGQMDSGMCRVFNIIDDLLTKIIIKSINYFLNIYIF